VPGLADDAMVARARAGRAFWASSVGMGNNREVLELDVL